MRTLSKFASTAALALAITLVFSCSSDDSSGNNSSGGDPSSPSGGGGACTQTSKIQGEPVTYQGETYPTVVICGQTWFAKNLNVEADGSLCYDNLPANCTTYGRLYDWETAMTICPDGWKLPSQDEWNVLIDYVGGFEVAGKYLKATSGWNEGGNGTDDYGFAGLSGGIGYSDGHFSDIGKHGAWFTNEYNEYDSKAYYYYMSYNNEYASLGYSSKKFSVRCIKD